MAARLVPSTLAAAAGKLQVVLLDLVMYLKRKMDEGFGTWYQNYQRLATQRCAETYELKFPEQPKRTCR